MSIILECFKVNSLTAKLVYIIFGNYQRNSVTLKVNLIEFKVGLPKTLFLFASMKVL